jgi:hypothetical protein
MLANSCVEHMRGIKSHSAELNGEDRYDVPTLIFGSVAEDLGKRGLKRRAAFDVAIATRPCESKTLDRTILLSPKPNYYPIYVVQPIGEKRDQLPRAFATIDGRMRDVCAPFATYTPLDKPLDRLDQLRQNEQKTPKLAGIKVWPARGEGWREAKLRPSHLDGERALQTTLKALDVGATFATKLRFHNLRPIELGALLWVLTFGKPEAWSNDQTISLRHRLGMGKPFGLGEITVRVKGVPFVVANDPRANKDWAVADLVNEFRKEMIRFNPNWESSQQVATLLRVADPSVGERANVAIRYDNAARASGRAFDYMEVKTGTGGWNDFATAKRRGNFLPPYFASVEDETSTARRPGPYPSGQVPGQGRGTSKLASMAQPTVIPAVPPAVAAFAPDMRVRVGAFTGTIVEVIADAKPPACRVKLDKSGKVVRYLTKLLTAIP